MELVWERVVIYGLVFSFYRVFKGFSFFNWVMELSSRENAVYAHKTPHCKNFGKVSLALYLVKEN